MNWHKSMKGWERYFDRLHTAAITLWVLKISGYLAVSWTAILVCWIGSMVGGLVSAVLASLADPNEPQPQSREAHQ